MRTTNAEAFLLLQMWKDEVKLLTIIGALSAVGGVCTGRISSVSEALDRIEIQLTPPAVVRDLLLDLRGAEFRYDETRNPEIAVGPSPGRIHSYLKADLPDDTSVMFVVA
jgi:hypothetical protein